MRLDKLLWFLRLCKTRPLAQTLAEDGHIRLNGRRVDRAAQRVGVGDVLVVPLLAGVRVIRILAMPDRRGPAAEAQACYQVLTDAGSGQTDLGGAGPGLDGAGAIPIAAGASTIVTRSPDKDRPEHQGKPSP